MSTPLVECVPNFSDARRPEVIDAIQESIASVKEVFILDRHMDHDHNRSVITFVGTPSGVEEAAFQAIKTASKLINLDEHEGEHPRIGATDVVPFIPIREISMDECVEIARRVGERVGNTLQIPVYLYEEAATRPERKNLANIRRGEYEALKEEIGEKPEREPDYGPAKVGPAGATVIGARNFLIAYNVYLTTDDVEIAKKIARAVRHSSGGLRYVKALGLLVDGIAQVSMNLTNYRKTPIARVVEFIRREAKRYGVDVRHSELVGLIPQEALVDASVWYTQMDQFEPEQVLESRMYAALEDSSSDNFIEDLAAGTPTPGGGSAAAHAGAMGAALVAMVARLTVNKKKYADVAAEMEDVLFEAETLRRELTTAVEDDANAFEVLMDAFRLPKDDESRGDKIQQATLHAAMVPLSVAGKCVKVIELAETVVSKGNVNAISDGASGAAMAQAGLISAGYNVRINLDGLDDRNKVQELISDMNVLESEALDHQSRIMLQLQQRGGLSLA